MSDENQKSEALHPKTRARFETIHSMLAGLKRIVELGGQIHQVRMQPGVLKSKATIVGKQKKRAADDGEETPLIVERKKKKMGRPRKHRQKANESPADYKKRLDRERQRQKRSRDKRAGKKGKTQ